MFPKKALTSIFVLVMLTVLSACSGYNKLLKSSDFELKYQKAIEFYEEGDYNKAYPLLEELLSLYKGTAKAEKIYYYYAYTNYALGDYILASYHFKNFAKTFPTSEFAEECLYMNAYCFYLDSPEPSLDQSNTYKAIDQMQLFVNKYPNSDSIPKVNDLIDDLRFKLETKAFEKAELYFHTEDYKAAIWAFDNFMEKYPASDYIEEAAFFSVKSHYLLAVNSIESKKEERLRNTIDSYHIFVDKYPEHERLKEAENIYSNTQRELKKVNNS